MLLNNYKRDSKRLVSLWTIFFILRLLTFLGLAVWAYLLSPKSKGWVWEHLTFTKTESSLVAITGIVANFFVTWMDFGASYVMHRRTGKEMKKTYSQGETVIMNKMKRHLKIILVGLIVALFAQMIHGILWWVAGGFTILFKFFYHRELKYLIRLKD